MKRKEWGNMEELISILMVNYNHADVIKETIESVLAQSYTNFQFIIVDDGSTDGSLDIINQFDDNRIEVYPQKKNMQICTVTNIGLKKMKGTYLARIDSDDIWEPEKLEKQIRFLKEHSEYEICFSLVDIIDEEGNEIDNSPIKKMYEKNYTTQEQWLEQFFFKGNCVALPSVIMTKRVVDEIGNFNICYMQAHDFDYWIRVAKRYPMYVMQEALIKVRRYNGEKNNSNLSEINTTRFYNEYLDIKKHFFDDMDNDLFKRTFQKYFRDKNANGQEKLECEKAFLLCIPCEPARSIPFTGIERLGNLFQKQNYVDILEKEYNFNIKDFYIMTGKHLYNDYFLEQAKEKNSNLERENRNLKDGMVKQDVENKKVNDELTGRIKELEHRIEEYEYSTSWQLTKPFRTVMKAIRRK